MKNTFKTLAVLLAAIMLVSLMSVNVFAAGTNTITVSNTTKDAVYSLYKLLDLDVDASETAYTYTVATGWETFFATGDGSNYVAIDTNGYVTWDADDDEDTMVQFGKDAAAAVPATALDEITSATTGSSVTFSGLDNGYYLVTSTLGTKAIVLTAPNTAEGTTIEEKNEKNTIVKGVHENTDANPDSYGETNDDYIGKTINFRSIITVKDNNEGFVLHDSMTEGLTFIEVTSIVISYANGDDDATLVEDTDYTVDESPADNHSFDVVFVDASTASLVSGDTVTVYYTAKLNENAVIAGTGNTNDTYLSYGENGEFETNHSTTTTYTYAFDVIKTKANNDVLDGAKFDLYDAVVNGNKINLVKVSDGVYRPATPEEEAAEGFESADIETVGGRATVKFLDSKTSYYLEETAAPAGYNPLDARVEVELTADTYADKILNGTLATTYVDENKGVHIVNNTGSLLPGTGGIGTTIFYVVGGIMVLAAVVFLVVRKRMSAENAE